MNKSISLPVPYSALALLISIALTSCGSLLKSDYQRPPAPIPAHWANPSAPGTSLSTQQQWWKSFNDSTLNALIDKALASNNELAKANIRVHIAQLHAGLVNTNLTPTVTLGASTSTQSNLSTTASLSYELDLWGRLARARDAAAWEAQATELDRHSTALSVIGTTAKLYWQIAALNQFITNAHASLQDNQQMLALARLRYRAGAVSKLDEVQAEQSVAAQTSMLTSLLQQRDSARNTLALLFNQAPEHREIERQNLNAITLPLVPAGVPADILSHRPDVQAAEQRLRKSLASVDAKRADFYPDFSLTGTLGSSSASLSNLLANPSSTIALNLALPFIQWNTAHLNLQVSQADYEIAVIHFRDTLYKALAEVEDALSARTHYLIQHKQLQNAFELATQAAQIAKVRYETGQTSLQEWLTQQEASRSAESTLVENRHQQLNNTMKLYQALGGGPLNPAKTPSSRAAAHGKPP